jgi:hypothetical protein
MASQPQSQTTEARKLEFDAYLSYNPRDIEAVSELEDYLKNAGLSVFAETPGETGAISSSPLVARTMQIKFAVVCVGPTGLSGWQLDEIQLAEARATNEPDFRFAAALLPGVPNDFTAAALPIALATRQWIDLRPGISAASALVEAIEGHQDAPAAAVRTQVKAGTVP